MRKALYLMGILNDTDVQWLASNGSKMLFDRARTLITQGLPIEHLFSAAACAVVSKANCAVVSAFRSAEPSEAICAVVSAVTWAFVRFEICAEPMPPSASVVAQVPTIVLAVEKALLKRKLEADGAFGARFYRAIALFLADRLRATTGRLGYASTGKEEAPFEDPDELDADFMQVVSMANVRFDFLIRSVK